MSEHARTRSGMRSDVVACVAVIPVAQGKNEIYRAQDLVDSVVYWEPAVSGILLLDDCPNNRNLTDHIRVEGSVRLQSIVSPRNGLGYGHLGGLCCGILHSLRWLVLNWNASFVVKLDTDSLVIGPFANWLGYAAYRDPSAGLFGTVGITNNRDFYSFGSELYTASPLIEAFESEKFWTHRNQSLPLPSPFTNREELRAAQVTPFAALASPLLAAMSRGYRSLDFCQGGAYAISWKMLEKLEALGYLDSAAAWTYIPIWEDVAMGMYAYASGFAIRDGSQEGSPFASQWNGLSCPPEDLLSKGHSIIHSIKNSSDYREADIRRFFAALRQDKSPSPDISTNGPIALTVRRNSIAGDGHNLLLYTTLSTKGRMLKDAPCIAIFAGCTPLQFFDSLSQLLGLVAFYRQRLPNCTIALLCPFLVDVANDALRVWSHACLVDILFYSRRPLSYETTARFELDLLPEIYGLDVFHACGDIASDSLILDPVDSLLDRLLYKCHPRKYILSNVRAYPRVSTVLRNHFVRWGPDLVGCQDAASRERLAGSSRDIFISRSDILDLSLKSQQGSAADSSETGFRGTVALQASLAPRDIGNRGDHVPPKVWQYAFGVVESAFETILDFGLRTIVTECSCSIREEYSDTPSVLKKCGQQIAQSALGSFSLASYAFANRIDEAASHIAYTGIKRLICTSNQVSVFFNLVGIPSFRIPVNVVEACYAKGDIESREALRQQVRSFLESPVALLREQMDVRLQAARIDRARWIDSLNSVVCSDM